MSVANGQDLRIKSFHDVMTVASASNAVSHSSRLTEVLARVTNDGLSHQVRNASLGILGMICMAFSPRRATNLLIKAARSTLSSEDASDLALVNGLSHCFQ